MISLNAYPFLAFSDLTCHLKETRLSVFLLHSVTCKETELGSSGREASPSTGENTSIVFVSCCAYKCVTTAISGVVDVSEVHVCHLLQQMSSQ